MERPRLPHAFDREAGRRTANGNEDPAALRLFLKQDQSSRSSSVREELFGAA
jgi:hypothetical protein